MIVVLNEIIIETRRQIQNLLISMMIKLINFTIINKEVYLKAYTVTVEVIADNIIIQVQIT